MQQNIKNDLLYLLSILESIGKINRYTESCTTADDFYFINEQLNFNASLNLLANIGELCIKTSKELQQKYSQIEWRKAKDFRNRIVHDYAGLDIYIVFKIIKTELPFLGNQLAIVIREELSLGTFDKEELNIAQDSVFYSHVDFKNLR